jgi:hypothetical protein
MDRKVASIAGIGIRRGTGGLRSSGAIWEVGSNQPSSGLPDRSFASQQWG